MVARSLAYRRQRMTSSLKRLLKLGASVPDARLHKLTALCDRRNEIRKWIIQAAGCLPAELEL
jgi:hypothetical protein